MDTCTNLGGSNSDGSNDRDGGYGPGLQPPPTNLPDNAEINGQGSASSGENDGAGVGPMESNNNETHPSEAANQETQSAENEKQEQRNDEQRLEGEREKAQCQKCALNVDNGQSQTNDIVNTDSYEVQTTELNIQESATGTGQSTSYAELANHQGINDIFSACMYMWT